VHRLITTTLARHPCRADLPPRERHPYSAAAVSIASARLCRVRIEQPQLFRRLAHDVEHLLAAVADARPAPIECDLVAVSRASAQAALLGEFMRGLAGLHEGFDPTVVHQLVQVFRDLAAFPVTGVGLPGEDPASRLAAACAYIEAHINEPGLRTQSVAAAHLGMPPRTVQELFAARHMAIPDFIRERRLVLAAARLADPLLGD
jgi:hypothetical protein